MFCRRCRVRMREQAHSAHKQRKFVCPVCGGARMKGGQERPRYRRKRRPDDEDSI